MELELVITSYQRLSPAVTSSMRFTPDRSWVIGRSESCDWHLPDPGKVMSSRHAEIRCDGDGGFHVRDLSTNGVFLNGSGDPLGRDMEAPVHSGDQLRFGDYELSATLQGMENESPAAVAGESAARPPPVTAPSLLMAATGSASTDQKAVPAPDRSAMASGPGSALASGLGERFLGDSHVEMPGPEIPDQWDWGAVTAPGKEASVNQAADGQLEALLDGLGLQGMAASDLRAEDCRALGKLTRTLLDRLLDLLHMRARQKQQLRVKQTLFQRSENNPLKFSATSADALESLLLRPHPSFLGPEEAVAQAFDDVVSHEHALLNGVEQVVADILRFPAGRDSGGYGGGVFRRRRQLAALNRQRQHHQQEYGDTGRMLRSDTFVDAYEQATSRNERE